MAVRTVIESVERRVENRYSAEYAKTDCPNIIYTRFSVRVLAPAMYLIALHQLPDADIHQWHIHFPLSDNNYRQ